MLRIPIATYRLQLQPAFGFDQAALLAPYLDLLGITDVYTSPILTARPGSTRGTDVVDHSRLNPQLGGTEAFERWSDALRKYELGLIVDVVPGYMSAHAPLNGWWTDVLENGPGSPFAEAFDIDWRSTNPALVNRVLLPILKEPYGQALEAGQLQVEHRHGSFWLRCQDSRLPLDPRTWGTLLKRALEPGTEKELGPIIEGLEALPARDELGRVQERRAKKAVLEARLMKLIDGNPKLARAIDDGLRVLNGKPGVPSSFDELHALLDRQAFRVASWRVASDEINYRRFRDMNDLIALKVEQPRVFEAVHEVVLDLVREGRVTGLRIDSIDGVADPLLYLKAVQARCRTAHSSGDPERNIYLVVDKVLSDAERLPPRWPVHGTTGYDFLNQAGGVFVDQQGTRALLDHYVRLTHQRQLFPEIARQSKKLALERNLASQLAMLGRRLSLISEQQRSSRDFTGQDLSAALVEVIACLPVYRTYLPLEGELSDEDAQRIDEAIAAARQANPALPGPVFDFVRSVMVLEHPPGLGPEQQAERRAFTLQLQQISAGVMNRALENIACYRFYPLSSSGEVGADPEYPAVPLEALHRHNRERLDRHPHGLLATSTHETHRGEDVRARIGALSRAPQVWAAAFERFHEMNQQHCVALPEGHAPDANEQWLFYQTLLGVWPFEPLEAATRAALSDRLCAYMVHVLREAKVHSSEVSPNEAWERAVTGFVEKVLLPATSGPFLGPFETFAQPFISAAVWSSLAQVLLKVASPGVPDFYQGSELWDLSLSEPDNRRSVDFGLRERLLRGLLTEAETHTLQLIDRLVQSPGDGRLKLYVTQRALASRRAHHTVFERGTYVPLDALGPQADRVVAFAREYEGKTYVAACGRFVPALSSLARAPLGEETWSATRLWLPPGHASDVFRDAFTGQRWTSEDGSLRLSQLFNHLPLALLESVDV